MIEAEEIKQDDVVMLSLIRGLSRESAASHPRPELPVIQEAHYGDEAVDDAISELNGIQVNGRGYSIAPPQNINNIRMNPRIPNAHLALPVHDDESVVDVPDEDNAQQFGDIVQEMNNIQLPGVNNGQPRLVRSNSDPINFAGRDPEQSPADPNDIRVNV